MKEDPQHDPGEHFHPHAAGPDVDVGERQGERHHDERSKRINELFPHGDFIALCLLAVLGQMPRVLVQVPCRHPFRDDEQYGENIRCKNRVPVHFRDALHVASAGREAGVHDLAQSPHVLAEVPPLSCETDRLEAVLVVELEYPDIGQTRIGLDFANIDESPVVLHPQTRVKLVGHNGAGQ